MRQSSRRVSGARTCQASPRVQCRQPQEGHRSQVEPGLALRLSSPVSLCRPGAGGDARPGGQAGVGAHGGGEMDLLCPRFQSGDANQPERLLRKTFVTRPRSQGLWVRVRLKDNDLIEGLAPNDLTLLEGEGIFLVPPDTRSNTQRIFLPRQAVAELDILAVIKTGARRGPGGSGAGETCSKARTRPPESGTIPSMKLAELARLLGATCHGDQETGDNRGRGDRKSRPGPADLCGQPEIHPVRPYHQGGGRPGDGGLRTHRSRHSADRRIPIWRLPGPSTFSTRPRIIRRGFIPRR